MIQVCTAVEVFDQVLEAKRNPEIYNKAVENDSMCVLDIKGSCLCVK